MIARLRTLVDGWTPRQRVAVGALSGLAVVLLVVAIGAATGDDDPQDSLESADLSTTSTSAATTTTGDTSTTEATTTTSDATTTSTPDAPTTLGSTAPTTAAPTTAPPTTPAGPPALSSVGVRLTRVVRADAPIAADVGPDGRLWIAERAGRVRVLGSSGLSSPIVDISGDTDARGERGLLGMAVSPDGAHLYLSYTNRSGDSRIDEFRISGPAAVDTGSRRNVLGVDQPFANHNGGHVTFGPDGRLYVGLGDGGSGGDPQGHGQNTDTLLGSILRIDPRPSGGAAYSVPGDNPFVGRAGRDEIFVYGLRNPWRFSFDAATGDLWIGDVGQNTVEEIDHLPAGSISGANLGWSRFEGTRRFSDTAAPGAIGPVFEYGRSEGQSVTGGVVVRDPRIPALDGAYLFSDFLNGSIRALRLGADGSVADESPLGIDGGSPATFVADPAGRVHILSLTGDIFRLDPA